MLTENQSDFDLTDSFIGQSFKNEIRTSLFYYLADRQTDVNDRTLVSNQFPLPLFEEVGKKSLRN